MLYKKTNKFILLIVALFTIIATINYFQISDLNKLVYESNIETEVEENFKHNGDYNFEEEGSDNLELIFLSYDNIILSFVNKSNLNNHYQLISKLCIKSHGRAPPYPYLS